MLKYLARYTHRVAISNQRLLSLADGQVTFAYKDYAECQRHKRMTLPAEEFLRRFVQHVLPKGFVKIRHYGLLANRGRDERLTLCRRLLLPATVAAQLPAQTSAVEMTPARQPTCPQCGGQRLVVVELLPEPALPRRLPAADSS